MADVDLEQFEFGSAHRTGRAKGDYQLDRLRRLAEFQLELAAAQRERLTRQERRAREVWLAKLELENLAQPREARIRELESWARELSASKDWLENKVAELEGSMADRRREIGDLLEAKEWLEGRCAELERSVVDRQRVADASELRASGMRAAGEEWKRQLLFRLLRKAGLLRDLDLG